MSENTPPEPTTHFGFKDVKESDKARMVGRIFSTVAKRYDLMNDLMSAGVHRLWKGAFVDWLAPRPGLDYLDVAGGTGDIGFRILERIEGRGVPSIIVCDINADMLAVGRERAQTRKGGGDLEWVAGDAERLPLPDASVDVYTIAFGIRNVTHIDRALREAARVLKPGGRFMCLEFSRVDVPWLDQLYERWSFDVIPEIGARITDDREAYVYLVESIRRFPDQRRFAGMIANAGLSQVKVRNLSGGIAAIHSAWKI
ncbi:MAG: bifunctional demethylmenaquinone methyltransferase/2-methoxy-6-polyprenyl-1,4-benzoquinol methylase UbiE [Alphaproteobacteria bacterium]|nr:bifunctional demethylmenaquinone methyltransferase/2-methoxy-6-polyprenyl-1,4-benzoquinol methylase UbiE [Alphaproteobacteria bacterium]